MTRVLVISASTGGGHNITVGQIASSFHQVGCEVKIVGGIKAVSPLLDKVISDGYETSAKYVSKYRVISCFSEHRSVGKDGRDRGKELGGSYFGF